MRSSLSIGFQVEIGETTVRCCACRAREVPGHDLVYKLQNVNEQLSCFPPISKPERLAVAKGWGRGCVVCYRDCCLLPNRLQIRTVWIVMYVLGMATLTQCWSRYDKPFFIFFTHGVPPSTTHPPRLPPLFLILFGEDVWVFIRMGSQTAMKWMFYILSIFSLIFFSSSPRPLPPPPPFPFGSSSPSLPFSLPPPR